MSLAATELLREQAAEPGRCWIRHAPVRWPAPERPWLDLVAGRLGEGGGTPDLLAALEGPRLEDVLYLPPVPPALAAGRDRLGARHGGRGTPVLMQLLPGDAPPAEGAGATVVWDLLPLALEPSAAFGPVLASSVRAGDAAVWPLAPGLVDVERLDELAAALAAAGIVALQGVTLELSGRDRRALGEAMSEERYLRLFHGDAPSAGALAAAAARHGLRPLLPRPLPRPPLHGAGNLRLAAALASCAELCLLVGEPESRAQTLLRAARFAERGPHDLTALAREGNLGVVPWLEGEAGELVAEAAGGGEPALWRRLVERLAGLGQA